MLFFSSAVKPPSCPGPFRAPDSGLRLVSRPSVGVQFMLRDSVSPLLFSCSGLVLSTSDVSSRLLVSEAVFILGNKPPICLSFCGQIHRFRGRQIGGLFWSGNLPPRGVHFLPPPLLCKSGPSMCRHQREMGGGVNDLHCCATYSRGVLKPGNS